MTAFGDSCCRLINFGFGHIPEAQFNSLVSRFVPKAEILGT
ncbi:hypothetical protein [Roseateles sp.]